MNRLHDKGQLSDGNYLEFLKSHANVVFQPTYDDRRFSGFNPYALGFAMMQDIERIVTQPTEEDRSWFPDIAGRGDVMGVLRGIWADYRDESFVAQFLSPHLIRQLRLFHLYDDPEQEEGILVSAIHDERGYRRIRRQLAREYDIGWTDPGIEIVDVDLAGDRRLLVQHRVTNDWMLQENDTKLVLQHLADLWGYDVLLQEIDGDDAIVAEHHASPRGKLF